MKSLVIGAGSIGLRHLSILNELGHKTAIVTKRTNINNLSYIRIESALELFKPNYIIIANETNNHISTLNTILDSGFQHKILIEKPLSNNLQCFTSFALTKKNIFVGYNLRYHPFIHYISNLLKKETILSANIYTGQYLPNWRPDRDYKFTYSSDYKKGGGVLLELSHEFDYMLYLFGKCKKNFVFMSKLTDLKINCADSAVGILEFDKCKQISFNFNLIDKLGRREIILNTNENTYKFDIYNNVMYQNEKKTTFNLNKNETYKNMHLDITNNNGQFACTVDNATECLQLIKTIQDFNNLKDIYNE